MSRINSLYLFVVVFLHFLISGCAQIAYPIGLKDCAPVYGSWCGEGYPSEGNDPYPVDDWDAACRTHDYCYKDAGDNKAAIRKCDDAFLDDLQDLDDGRPIPVEMRNAFSWFSKRHTGQLYVWVPAKDAMWSTFANCDGSDGKPALFCETSYGSCEMEMDLPEHSDCYCMGRPWGMGMVTESY